MNPTALIAEDEPLLAENLRAELATAWPALQVTAQAGSGTAAVELALQHRPQVCFLDIRMPGMTGLEAAQAISEDWPDDAGELPLFVFVTAYDQYAMQAFDTAAADYLLKPVTPERLAQTVARLRARLAQPKTAEAGDATLASLRQLLAQAVTPVPRLRHLQAAVGDAIELVPMDDIVYLEAADKYVRAVTAERDYWVRVSLRELLPQLDTERFWQVHRSTVVQIDAVARALRQENGTVLLELRRRPEKLTVSRVHANRFKAL
ncbi:MULTISPECIES: LytTR family DNA-binding domain-containing protein [unclassified Roseateles]|uniref:LytR/AlgR family response regulator transcription factor n=1 Tax=unclassified Roseateles TaxID=2626991 RepID=UPI0006FE08AA|nr:MULTISPECIES: LytTR family DNA-binding domain-containing protein [unclassified Roseateles]KQW51950.1 LytR family transcriptional regulator [Pelomonas sp. Root405]KRA78183.1 LytR family transcriptional regulator [Pelomonas sp. Root662]